MPAKLQLEAQRTIDLESDVLDEGTDSCPIPAIKGPKRKPSARSPWKVEEIPAVLDGMRGYYRVRNQAMLATNLGWGLRVTEDNSLTVGDICHTDGSLREEFIVAPERLKGGHERKPWTPKPKPKGHGKSCPCNLCNQKEPKRTPPIPRKLPITPEMRPYLYAWLKELKARVGTLSPDTPLWLSRKRTKDGRWKAISRQQHWHIIVSACKTVHLPGFDWHDFGSHSARKTVVTVMTDQSSILDASRYICHKSLATTQVYYKANPRRERENVGKMVALLLPAVAA